MDLRGKKIEQAYQNLVTLEGSVADEGKTYAVTVQNVGGSNYYFIDGVQQDSLILAEGQTYIFDQSDASNSGHPFRLSETDNGTHGGGVEYTTGVTYTGTAGSDGQLEFVVPSGAPSQLYYYCSVHSGMGGGITVQASVVNTATSGALHNGQGTAVSDISVTGTVTANSFAGDGSQLTGVDTNNLTSVDSFIPSGSDSNIVIPSGDSGSKTSSPQVGSIYFNTQTGNLEVYNGTIWGTIGFENFFSLGSAEAIASANDGIAQIDLLFSSWSTTSSMTRNYQRHGTGGGVSSAISMGYYSPQKTQTDYYNGSSWATTSNCTLSMGIADGSGSATDYLYCHGYPSNANRTVVWNGSTWGNTSNTPTSLYANAVVGSPSSARSFGGGPGDTGPTTTHEYYNGSSWSNATAMPRSRNYHNASGSINSAIVSGDRTRSLTVIDYWNGASWATTATHGFKHAGPALLYGKALNESVVIQRYDPDTATHVSNCSVFDGVSWSTAPTPGVDTVSSSSASSADGGDYYGILTGGGYSQTSCYVSI